MARHVLAVWNPEIKPDTIELHAEKLRRAATARVWWARIYLGAPEKRKNARVSLGPLEELDALARQERLVLFVTDFSSLHALQIDRVGDERDADDDDLPDYLRAHQLLHAFRAHDMRVVSHDRLATLTWMRENLGVLRLEDRAIDPARYRVDPYKSLNWAWPIEVEGPEIEDLFPRVGTTGTRWVDRPETLHPPRMAAAVQRLGRKHHEIWLRLAPESRLFLATADVVRRETREMDFDPSPTLVGITRAVERELRDGVFLPILAAGRAGHHAGPELATTYTQLDRELGDEPAKVLTLGAMPIVARKLRDWLAPHPALSPLTEPDFVRWLSELARVRNDASHGRLVDPAVCRGLVDGVLDGTGLPILKMFVAAKEAVGGLFDGASPAA